MGSALQKYLSSRYFSLSLSSVLLKWLHSDFLPVASGEEYLTADRPGVSPGILIVFTGHCCRNISSSESGEKKKREIFPLG